VVIYLIEEPVDARAGLAKTLRVTVGAPPSAHADANVCFMRREETADMGGMLYDAKCHPQHRGHAVAGPDLATEAIGRGTTGQEVGEAGELLDSQSLEHIRGGECRNASGPAARARIIH
jgi:hypothetical protein